MSEINVETGGARSEIANLDYPAGVPRCCTLAGFVRETDRGEGIAIQSLAAGTTFIVQTRNSRYRFIVMTGVPHGIIVKGGGFFREATPALLQGASAGGCFVKTGWIGVGLCVELLVGRRRIVTSPVRSIAIESVPPPASRFQHDA